MDPVKLQSAIQQYSSLTRLMITLGFDAARGVKALIGTFHNDLSIEEQDAILAGVMANSEVREDLARAAAGQTVE